MMNLRVTISVGGPFPSPFRLAEFLEREGCLERVVTFMPRFRLTPLTVEDRHFASARWIGLTNYGLSRVPCLGAWTAARNYHVAELFERFVIKHLGTCNLFSGWCTAALHSMRKAKSLGAVTVLNTGSAHIAYQKQLLDAEYAKFGVKRVITDSRMVEKGTQEFIEADHIIVASSFVRRTLLDQGIDASKVSVVPDAVTRRFQLAVKEDRVFRILAVGRIEFRKGIQYLLEAVKRLRLPNSELLLVGGLQEEFVGLLQEYDGCYRLAGRVSDEQLGKLYSQSSIFVLPSVEDGWGHVTLEAMSCGVPVIVSANAGSADAVIDGQNGFVVPAGNVEALMERIELLYKDPAKRAEMGRQAALFTNTRTWDTYGARIRDLYAALVFGSGGSTSSALTSTDA